MYTFLNKLKNRSLELGNHVRKYIRSIELYGDTLIRLLEQKGMINQVHLWKESRNPSDEMDIIRAVAGTREEQLSLLGCYYGIQFLHMNLRAIDVFFLNTTAKQNRLSIYKDMQFRLGINFRRLNAAYIAKTLDLFLPSGKRPKFAICGVGTRYDQDDLDLGIIDEGTLLRKELNSAIGLLNCEMIKWAVPLHFHLSQYVGEPGFTASIDEYQQLLQRQIHDFIIISEMLSAKLIVGNAALFKEFETKVTSRYYYDPEQSNLFHEGYLRGMLGEVRSLLLQPMKKEILAPKEDAIRMIKGLLYCEKTMFSIQSANNYEILNELRLRDSLHQNLYFELEKLLLFFETFRFLYQLLIIQDEEVLLNTDNASDNLKIVARYMGYSGIGTIGACDQLLTHYFENIVSAREKTEQVFEIITQHLLSISSFSRLRQDEGIARRSGNSQSNVAMKFAELILFFTGTKFWDDVIKTLESDEMLFLQKLVNDLYQLPAEQRKEIIARYVDLCHYSFFGLFSLIMVVTRHVEKLSHPEFLTDLNDCLFQSVTGSSEEARRLTKVFSYSPLLINDFLSSLSVSRQHEFIQLLQVDLWEEEVARFRRKLLKLARLHCCTSQYFKRFFLKAVTKYPESLFYLEEPDTLKHIASGLLGEVDRRIEIKQKKLVLGEYFNIEFLRAGIELLNGADFHYVNSEFTDFSDTYLQTLFDLCRMETDEEWIQRIATHDLLAIYVTGGHARGHAFDDDYDIIAVLNTDDEDLHEYSSKIISRMNAEIMKRGVLPHFRFSEYTGYFVVLTSELAQILSGHENDNFIDKAQLLGSRRVVGSSLFDSIFEQEIIRPFIFEQKDQFIQDMLREMKQRHLYSIQKSGREKNVKESLGGLRDIEMFFLILKAHFEVVAPISNELINKLCLIDVRHQANYLRLKQRFDSLKHLRDVYRLSVTADDELDPNYLRTPAEILGFQAENGLTAEENLLRHFQNSAGDANKIIQSTLADLGIK